jgi:methionine-rich copper-binding protein CopC
MSFCSRTIWKTLASGIGIFLAVFALNCSAWAHAIVIDSIPEDGAVLASQPMQIILRFNARIEKSLSSVKLLGREGHSFPVRVVSSGNGAASAPDRLVVRLPRLGPGEYTLQYNVLATDGHLTPGVLHFSISKGQ